MHHRSRRHSRQRPHAAANFDEGVPKIHGIRWLFSDVKLVITAVQAVASLASPASIAAHVSRSVTRCRSSGNQETQCSKMSYHPTRSMRPRRGRHLVATALPDDCASHCKRHAATLCTHMNLPTFRFLRLLCMSRAHRMYNIYKGKEYACTTRSCLPLSHEIARALTVDHKSIAAIPPSHHVPADKQHTRPMCLSACDRTLIRPPSTAPRSRRAPRPSRRACARSSCPTRGRSARLTRTRCSTIGSRARTARRAIRFSARSAPR